ncbi:MAG: hypothetical protein WKG32_03400 [Gemmatimonadaceae bacterium]
MAIDHAPRMSNEEYFRCLETAANASSAEEVRQLRAEVIRRWRGDPRADDLTEALHAHQTRYFSAVDRDASGGRGLVGERSRIQSRTAW